MIREQEGDGEMVARCPSCGNPRFHRRAGGRDCTHCGLPVPDGVEPSAVMDAVRAALERGAVAVEDGWTAHALRDVAWAHGFTLAVAPDGRRAVAAPAVPRGPAAIVVAVMVRLDQVGGALSVLKQAEGFRGAVLLLDAEGGAADGRVSPGLWGTRVALRVAARLLGTDFAAQRNRMQELAEHWFGPCWVLQLDADERLTPGALAALGWVAAAAEADGIESVGLPRRNLVEGRLSALFPDLQYRLNRSSVRFAGAVHERPAVPFERTALALCAPIEHELFHERVLERTEQYEAIRPGAGRPQDAAALSRPFEPGPLPLAARAAGEPARERTAVIPA